MSIFCPKCNSPNVVGLKVAQRTCATIGTVGGAIYGYRIGAVVGPVGMFTGAMAGLICGAFSGCEVGHAVGKMIDEKVINKHMCNACHYIFIK